MGRRHSAKAKRISITSAAILFLLAATPIYSTVLFGGVDSGTITLFAFSTSLIVLMWAINSWKAGEFGLYFSPLYIPLLGLLLVGLVQLLPLRDVTGSNETLGVPAADSLSLDQYSTRFFLIRLFFYLIFFAAAFTFINSEKRVRRMAWLTVLFGTIEAFFGILQWLAKPDAIYGLRTTPQAIPFGPFINQHHFAAFMEMTGGIAIGILLGKGLKRDRKLILAIGLVIMVIAMLLTGSRGGSLSFVVVCAFSVIATLTMSPKRRSRPVSKKTQARAWMQPLAGIFCVAFVVVGGIVFLGGESSFFRSTGIHAAGQSDITSGRAGFWRVALQIFFAHPIIGAGFDAFGSAFTKFDPSSGAFRVEQAHNDYLQMLADGGVAAFTFVIAFLILLFRKGSQKLRNVKDPLQRSIVIGSLAGCCGIAVHSFLDFPLRTPSNAFFFLLLCVFATARIGENSDRDVGRPALISER